MEFEEFVPAHTANDSEADMWAWQPTLSSIYASTFHRSAQPHLEGSPSLPSVPPPLSNQGFGREAGAGAASLSPQSPL